MKAEVIDFKQARIKARLLENDQHFRQLAKRVVESYHLHGEEGYNNTFLTACQGDKDMAEILKVYVEKEINKGVNR